MPKLNSTQQSRQQLLELAVMRDLGVALPKQGVEVKAKGLGDGIDSPSLEIKLDATVGRAIAMRKGAGRTRHIATPILRLQRLVINGDIKMTRVGGHDKCADLGTKHLDYQTMNKHFKFCSMRFARHPFPLPKKNNSMSIVGWRREHRKINQYHLQNFFGREREWEGGDKRKKVMYQTS